jgi:beta-aspartyl-dipeptidase (metallo-type)
MTADATRLLLVKGGEVFAPRRLGARDILIAGEKILRVGPDLDAVGTALGADRIDAGGLRVAPGFIDQHVHLIGGGDANGPGGRVSELDVSALTLGGTTTAVGLLGVDMQTRGLPLLLRKAHELTHAGISAFIYSGAMGLPAPHLLQSVLADVAFIDQVLGAKTALAEKLHPNRDRIALAALAGELMQARAMSGKAAVLHCHVGGLAEGLEALFYLVQALGLPPDQVIPTHVNRTPDFSPVFQHALRFAHMGGTIDFTCCVSQRDGNPTGLDVPDAVRAAREAGVPLEQMTVSTDSNVPVAVRDQDGRLLHLRVAPPSILHRDVMRVVHETGLPLEQALTLVTTNVARVLGLGHRKGRIAPGLDADLVLLDDEDRVDTVLARGRIMVRAGKAVPSGPFVSASSA